HRARRDRRPADPHRTARQDPRRAVDLQPAGRDPGAKLRGRRRDPGALSMSDGRQFIAVHVGVLTVSDTRTTATDTSGQLAVDRLTGAGHVVVRREIVRDDRAAIRAALQAWIDDPEVEVIVTTGGTG